MAPGWRTDGADLVDERRPRRQLHVRGRGYAEHEPRVHAELDSRLTERGPAAKVAAQCSVRVTHVETKKGYDLQIDTSGSGTGSPNVPATVTVEVTGPNGVVGQPVTVGPDGKATVAIRTRSRRGRTP